MTGPLPKGHMGWKRLKSGLNVLGFIHFHSEKSETVPILGMSQTVFSSNIKYRPRPPETRCEGVKTPDHFQKMPLDRQRLKPVLISSRIKLFSLQKEWKWPKDRPRPPDTRCDGVETPDNFQKITWDRKRLNQVLIMFKCFFVISNPKKSENYPQIVYILIIFRDSFRLFPEILFYEISISISVAYFVDTFDVLVFVTLVMTGPYSRFLLDRNM